MGGIFRKSPGSVVRIHGLPDFQIEFGLGPVLGLKISVGYGPV